MNDSIFSPDTKWFEDALNRLQKAKVAILGDFCVDAYWLIDPDQSELSVETNLRVQKVRLQRYSLGGAANVAANLAALGLAKVSVIGLIGDDMFGRLMRDMLSQINVDHSRLLSWKDDWQTPVFGKPYLNDQELNRLDFGAFNTVTPKAIDAVIAELDRSADQHDVIILNQQLPGGLGTPDMIERINKVAADHARRCRFIVDSRDRAELYRGVMLKVNEHEAARIVGSPRPLDEPIDSRQARRLAGELFERTKQPVFVTRGKNGIIVASQSGLTEIPGIQILEQIDTVGAGDTAVAALAAVTAGGGDVVWAAGIANIAASVTVRKIRTTGTATIKEIREIGPMPDYVYLPDLADDPRLARFVGSSEIELVRQLPDKIRIRHAIFDHDGTISTLRQGWERIMEDMSVRAILGRQYDQADSGLYRKVVDHVRRFIDRTTGFQTLVQMNGLAEMVRRFSCVSEDVILDMHGYKAIYNESLLKMVQARIDKLNRGELESEDFQIKGAIAMLRQLHDRGVSLYLASGTDQADIEAEAKALGYADLFEGRIYGAVGDINVEAKRIVIERILREHRLGGERLVTFGDGPVEIRETHKRMGIAVGIASDEVRRFGINPSKRSRLIRAGADIVTGDFTQLSVLLKLLGL